MNAQAPFENPTHAANNPLHASLALEGLNTHFQPIVSVKRKAPIGADALLQLDQACQRSALKGFATSPQRGLKPNNVVIEVNETQVQESSRLTDFVKRHRQQGFLIAMDDLGTGHSGLQRWPLLKPDIIKLDRSIVAGVDACLDLGVDLFQPSKPGTDHSDRDYFYGLAEAGNGRDFFLTEAHVSVATGQLCRTLSFQFQHPSGSNFIVCLDLRQGEPAA